MSTMKRSKEADEMIATFVADFHQKIGVFPRVSYCMTKKRPFNIENLLSVINDLIGKDPEVLAKIPEPNIRSKSRLRQLVLYRQCFYKIGSEMDYGPSLLASYTEQDHATAIHGCKIMNELLYCRNFQAVLMLNKIEDELKERFGNDGDVQFDNQEESNSEPVLSNV